MRSNVVTPSDSDIRESLLGAILVASINASFSESRDRFLPGLGRPNDTLDSNEDGTVVLDGLRAKNEGDSGSARKADDECESSPLLLSFPSL